MMKWVGKLSVFLGALTVMALMEPRAFSQQQGVVTRITTVPQGLGYTVDGQNFQGLNTFVWPAGSKHTLFVSVPLQNDIIGTTQYAFQNWASGTVTFSGQNPLIVTADPSLPEFHANFGVAYKLSIRYYPCSDPRGCLSPGTVYINGTPTQGNQDLYYPAGTQVTLEAVPGPSYVFGGWVLGPNQLSQGFLDTVTMNAAVQASPMFQVVHGVNFSTVPPGLQVLVDRTPLVAPAAIQWGWGSTHTVGAVTPQQDNHGLYWLFSSWSDGGTATHSYVVGQTLTPDSLTATYVQGERVNILTSPPGLQVTVDGRNNWVSNYFLWGAGETHQLVAPAQQTDSQGRIWNFSGWSNGGAAAQSFTVPGDSASLASGVVLTATYQPMGRLTVTSSLPGLSVQVDGSACNTPCDIQRPLNSQVKVSAPASLPLSPGSRADFLGWSDGVAGDHSITLGVNAVSLIAVYHVMNQLTVASNPAGGATLQVQPSSPDSYYDSQSSVNITVAAASGYRFLQWAGDLSGSTPSAFLDMGAPRSVQAILKAIPFIATPGVVNGAGSTPQPGIAPGSMATIFGGLLGTDTQIGPGNQLVQSLAGVSVTAGNRILPLYSVSPTQINFFLPADFPLGQAMLTVIGPSQNLPAPVTVVPDAPGLFQQMVDNQAFAVATHADGSPVTASSPAQVGELLTVYGTGFGSTNPPRLAGFAIPPQPQFVLQDPVTIAIGAGTITPQSAFAAPGQIGVDAIQFQVTDSSLSGTNATLSVSVNGQNSNTVFLPVQ